MNTNMIHRANIDYYDKATWRRSLVFNPLHYSVFIVPAIACPIVIITGKYSLFITTIRYLLIC